MKQILITGANRGIGLEMTRQFVQRGDFVFAGCRQPEQADDLQALSREFPQQLSIVALDVVDDDSVAVAKTAVSSQTNHLDILVNNAGINISGDRLDSNQPAILERTLQVNTIGPMRVITQFVDLLRRGTDAKLINISSQLGSLAAMEQRRWGSYSYNSSKAALNMLTRHLAHDLRSDGITVITMHPGWVQTDMGGKNAAVSVPDSARGIVRVIDNLTLADTNKFYIYTGEEHRW